MDALVFMCMCMCVCLSLFLSLAFENVPSFLHVLFIPTPEQARKAEEEAQGPSASQQDAEMAKHLAEEEKRMALEAEMEAWGRFYVVIVKRIHMVRMISHWLRCLLSASACPALCTSRNLSGLR